MDNQNQSDDDKNNENYKRTPSKSYNEKVNTKVKTGVIMRNKMKMETEMKQWNECLKENENENGTENEYENNKGSEIENKSEINQRVSNDNARKTGKR